ncbi:SPFH domain-containing protein [Emergencia timonensis]|uniref:Paraslipin n=2 Tax=Emergencia timonensis TaxID=1776384 RepID=A0A415E8L4_9FIRM|nr:stomatin-like protein [Emergencia timonensis]MBS6175805.1 paraslipin [Clostridiales bacterium]MCB6476399.1 paraslipin [Emergencia timonensis]RHJ90101.1 paraslipin [Emergencia timonensis]WNX90740.1 stomatin-like protein [Emergencia timonensis]
MGEVIKIIVIVVLIIVAIGLVVTNIRIVPQARAYVIERLGAYKGTWQVGLHFKVPLIDKISRKVSLKEKVIDFPPQPVITKDNVTMEIDTVIYFQITDPKLYAYGVESPMDAIENLTATTLRNIIGELELDESLTSRETINTKIRIVLDEATDPWGIKINRVEVKNITPPRDIQQAMEKQMRAERERREAIIRAEGEKKAAILTAEGHKEAVILEAEASKESKILDAEARKQASIREAEGQAEAIRMVKQATADGIKMLVESQPNKEVIALQGLNSFEKAADGQATKIIIPSEIAGLAGLATSLKELIKED